MPVLIVNLTTWCNINPRACRAAPLSAVSPKTWHGPAGGREEILLVLPGSLVRLLLERLYNSTIEKRRQIDKRRSGVLRYDS